MLRLHRSNRAERLVDALAEVVRAPLTDPFAAERIVVQSKGMERWLAMELSRRLGVWANPRFPFPRHLMEEMFALVLGDRGAAGSAFDEGALTWSIAGLLSTHLGEPAFAPVARYLEGDDHGARAIELAERIAGVFDDYVVYRPEQVLRWERGEGDDWQAVLFRDLVARHGAGHQAARARAFIARMEADGDVGVRLPERISVFGIATLPPLYMSVLAALARRVEVHLFVLAPSREYVADVGARDSADGEERTGPLLLGSLGRLGRDFQRVLEDRAAYVESDVDLFVDPAGGDEPPSALACLQSDLLHACRRGEGGDAGRLPLAPDDDSIAVHACHGPMREVEILHDQLVARLQDPSLAPHDIVVLTPDIEAYAPFVEAVFGVETGRPVVPYDIVRGRAESVHEVVDAFGAILDSLVGRMTASGVLDLLGTEVVRARFGIEAGEVETLRRWVAESGVRWGVDEEHRVEVGQPGFVENTWRFGLDRMLLGYAVEGDGTTMFEGRLPYPGMEGGGVALCGKLAELCERLFAFRRELAAPRPIAAWRDVLSGLVDAMLDSGPATAHQHHFLRRGLAALAARAERAGFDCPIDLATLRGRLAAALDDALSTHGFLSGGVTFCPLVPMRAVPFRVVCLLGMNDETFPRRSTALGFDAIRRDPRPGDRSAREDDRYAFLEALLSTRERLLVTYVGQGVRDNRVIPPSVVVAELLDAMRETFSLAEEPPPDPPETRPERDAMERRLVVRHRLHGFSPVYYAVDGATRLFSYAAHYCGGARVLGRERRDPVFLAGAVCEAEAAMDLTLEEFERYVTQPVREFLHGRLGVFLGDELLALEDREPVSLDGLAEWQIGSEALRLVLARAEPAALESPLRATGRLPLGTPGRLAWEGVLPDVAALASAAASERRGPRLDPLGVGFEIDGVRVTGVVRELWRHGHVRVDYSRVGARFELVHWVRHVLLNHEIAARSLTGYPRESVIVARASAKGGGTAVVRFAALRDPASILRDLVGFVRLARTGPVPFFRNASRAYAKARFGDGEDDAAALDAAREAFEKEPGGDAEDPHHRVVFDAFERVLDEAWPLGFREAAERVYAPFFLHRSGA